MDILLRCFSAPVQVRLVGGGLEAQYRPSLHYGFGGELDSFAVDNGTDPYDSPNGTLSHGYHGLAFVEGDLLPGFVTPFGRFGLGLGNYTRFRDSHEENELDFVVQAGVGVLLRGGPFLLRVSAMQSFYGKGFAPTYALALGARFGL